MTFVGFDLKGYLKGRAGFRLGEALSKLGGPLLKTGGPLRLVFEAPADCEALSCSLFNLSIWHW